MTPVFVCIIPISYTENVEKEVVDEKSGK